MSSTSATTSTAAALNPYLTQQAVSNQIAVSVAVKAKDAVQAQGAAVLKLLQQAVVLAESGTAAPTPATQAGQLNVLA